MKTIRHCLSMVLIGSLLVFFGIPLHAQERLFQSAHDHLEIGDTETALRVTAFILDRYPNHGDAFLLHSELLHQREGDGSVSRFFKRQVRRTRSPEQVVALVRSIDLDSSTEISLLRWVLQEGITNEDVYVEYVSLLNDAERWKKARTVLKEALNQYPNHTELNIELVESSLALGQLSLARERIRNLISSHPGDERINRLRTVLLLKRGNLEEARQSYDRYKAISDEPVSWNLLRSGSVSVPN